MKTNFNFFKSSQLKNSIALLTLLFCSNTFMAQSVFDKFENQSDIKTIVVNKKMFALMSKIDTNDKDSQQFVNLIKKLDNLKVYATSNDRKANEMKLISDKYRKTAGLEELMRVSEKGKNVNIYVKSGTTESQVKELLMFIEGTGKEDTVVLSLTGNFDIDELSALTDKMNLPGGEELKKAGKK